MAPSTVKSQLPPIFLETEVHPWFDFHAFPDNPYRAIFRTKNGYFYGLELVNEQKETRLNL